jgi:hypothetical protein
MAEIMAVGESALELRHLDPEQVRVFRAQDGRLHATIADEFTLISPIFVRSHPLTDPDKYIAIRGTKPKPDGEALGREFGLIRDWRRMDPESRALVEAALERRYLHPVVRRIVSLREFSGLQVCVLDTDRGMREVTLRDVRDNVIYLGSSRVLITDAEDNRYDIYDVNALDVSSRTFLARIL